MAFSQHNISTFVPKKKKKEKKGRPDYFQRTCFLGVSDMFLRYMNVVKCYYGNSNDCQIIIPTLRLDGCWMPLISPYNCLWLNWRFRILLCSFSQRVDLPRSAAAAAEGYRCGPAKSSALAPVNRAREVFSWLSAATSPASLSFFFSLESRGKSDEGKFN